MIQSLNHLSVDPSGRELAENGNHLFDLVANDGDVWQYANGYIPSHWHSEWEIFLLVSGRVALGIGQDTYLFEEGDACFINSGVLHSCTAKVSTPCHYRSFVFSSDIIGGAPGSIFDTNYVRPILENGAPFLFCKAPLPASFTRPFYQTFSACQEEQNGYEFVVRAALSELMYYVQSHLSISTHSKNTSLKEQRLKEMMTYIKMNLSETITLSSVAASANICERECQRIFRDYLHFSPMEYLARARVDLAANMLATTPFTITEIADHCGFLSPSYFSKQFKRYRGETPLSFRKHHRIP